MTHTQTGTTTAAHVNGRPPETEMERMVAESFHDPESVAAERALLSEDVHDEANANCVHLRHGKRFLHSEALGWLHHTGTHWTMSEAEAAVDRAITETLLARMQAAINSGQHKLYADILKKCVPNSSRVQGAKAQLRSLVNVADSQFDSHPDHLNCPNGVVDLRTGKMKPHSTDQRFMHCTKVDYAPDADQSVWADFLVNAVGPEAADWLQIAVGYSITGHTREEILFYLYGPPRSGKGTFTETLIELLGHPLAREVDFSTFIAQRTGDSQNFDLAPLKPCRFIAASESNQYERFNEAKIKKLTGGNDIYCAFKHHTHFNYRPQFKIWLSSNQPVNADPDDDAVWGRIRVIEFLRSYLGGEDKALKESMRTDDAILKGVLAWAIEGAMRWYGMGSAGLPELKAGAEIKNAQRDELDNIQAWIDERCHTGEKAFATSSALYQSYESWCKANGVEPKKQKGFSQALKRKGFTDARPMVSGKQARGFNGIGILAGI